MKRLLANFFHWFARPRRRKASSWGTPEPLEPRELLSLLAGETRVETATIGNQTSAAIALAPDDRSVTVWATSGNISAQRFSAAGAKVGTEIRVVTTTDIQSAPDVAMDDRGFFVVVWVDEVSVFDTNVKAQRFDAAGVKRGGAITVANSSSLESAPSVAVDAAGNFVVTWTVKSTTSTDTGVQARRFNDNGTAVGSVFVVANSVTSFESKPDVARAPDGRFVISYQSGPFGQSNVFLKRYAATGTLVGTHSITSGTNGHFEPRVSVDSAGNAMVVWEEVVSGDQNIRARRVTNAGAVGAIINVATSGNSEASPDVALKRDGSAFVVTYYDPLSNARRLVELTIAGSVRLRAAISLTVNAVSPVRQRIGIAFGSGVNYRVAYEKFPIGTSIGTNIYQRRGRLS
jgi:hypothetical protein